MMGRIFGSHVEYALPGVELNAVIKTSLGYIRKVGFG
jgi:hypothetical protein